MKQQLFYNKEEPIYKNQNEPKKKMEFMQKAVIISLMLPFVWVTFSYILAWCDKDSTLENLSTMVVSVPIATVVSYAIQNCSRAKWFKDKTKNKPENTIEGGNKRGC